MVVVLLVFPLGFNLAFLAPELSIVADLNDNVFALSLIRRMNTQLQDARYQILDTFDHWVSTWAMGYPLPFYYQHLPHLATVLLTKILTPLMKILNIECQMPNCFLFVTFRWIQYLLLSTFPLAIYYSARKFKLSKTASAFAALCSCLISTNFLYGLEYGSYVWRGSGMYTQLWGMFFLPLALSHLFITITEGRGLIGSILLLTATFASHTVFGLIAVVSGILMVLARAPFDLAQGREIRYHDGEDTRKTILRIWRRLPSTSLRAGKSAITRLVIVYAVSFLLLSYWLVPLVLNSQYHNRSFWDAPWKWDAFGFRETTTKFLNGELLDYGRVPILTLVTLLGFFVALRNFESLGFFVLLSALWFLSLFGRPTFGVLIDELPVLRELHLHRLIAGFHLASLYLMGIGFAALVNVIAQFIARLLNGRGLPAPNRMVSGKFATTIATGVVTLLLLPVFRERYQFLALNTQWIKENNISYRQDWQDFEKIVEKLRALPYGRIYAGRAGNWGKDFKVGMVQVYMVLNNCGFDTVGWLPETWSLNGDLEQFFDEGRWEHYNLFNVRYVVASDKQSLPSFAKLIESSGRYRLFEVDTSGNFAFVSSPLLVRANKDSIFNLLHLWMDSGWVEKDLHPTIAFGDDSRFTDYDLRIAMKTLNSYEQDGELHSLWEKNPFAEIPDTRYKILDTAKILEDIKGPNFFRAKVETSEPTILMLKASYHPQWQVFVDGKKKQTMMLAPMYIGVEIDEGTHQVEFRYQSSPPKKTLTIVSLMGLVGLLSFPLLRSKLFPNY